MVSSSNHISSNHWQALNPRLEIDLQKIRTNAQAVAELCSKVGVEVVGITKGCTGSPEIARAMLSGGVRVLGDSRLLNILRLKNAGFNVPLFLIRSPMPSEIEQVVELADASVNIDVSVLRGLANAARKQGKQHHVVLMVELGDQREGVPVDQVIPLVNAIKHFDGIKISGIGANIGCRSRIYPSSRHIQNLLDLRDHIKRETGIEIETVSAGGSAVLHLIESGDWPSGISQVRIGEAILLGLDGIEGRPIRGTTRDAFRLTAEVIEVKSWCSPVEKGSATNQGNMALIALGYQDIGTAKPVSLQSGLIPRGATSDHLLVEVTHSQQLRVGQEVSFLLPYSGLVAAFTSRYVRKVFWEANETW